jgi:hypothetical protein
MEVTKAPGDALSHLEEAVNRFDCGISQAAIQAINGFSKWLSALRVAFS